VTNPSRFLRIAALLALVSLSFAACGDDGSVLGTTASSTATSEATSTSGVTPSSDPTTTTVTAPPTTTSSLTTSTTSTSTTSTSTTTTTTTTAPPVDPLEFLADGLGIVDFGAAPPEAVGAVRDYLGFNATFDSGWGPAWGDYGACPGTEYRQVEFQGLTLQFSDVDRFQPAGTRHFIAWSYDGTPAGIAPFGIDVGMTVANLQALYPTVVLAFDDLWFGDVFRVDPGVAGLQLWGMLTGPNAGDTIIYITGGIGCGE